MIVVALLAALACLVVGLILTSSTWLIVSLVATALAAGLVVETRFRLSRAQRRAARSTPQPAAAAASHQLVYVIDARPRYHRPDCEILIGHDAEPTPLAQATEDGFIACSLCQPVGRPE